MTWEFLTIADQLSYTALFVVCFLVGVLAGRL
ncbi:MAG: hypothetical protein UZ03_NOB001001882 [Nitrospira sp. OLB3]|nr:MAG: hypothetical protein UZ03_NOB001001882 [Nitrospira sp. OLB3]